MKNKIYHNVRKVQKSNRNVIETETKIDTHNTQIHDRFCQ